MSDIRSSCTGVPNIKCSANVYLFCEILFGGLLLLSGLLVGKVGPFFGVLIF